MKSCGGGLIRHRRCTRLVSSPSMAAWLLPETVRDNRCVVGTRFFAGDDLIVANSRWTAAKLQERYGAVARWSIHLSLGPFLMFPTNVAAMILYAWPDIAEKRIERMIRIIGAVRSRGHDARIRIIGPLDASPYSKTIVALAQGYREWVCWRGEKWAWRRRESCGLSLRNSWPRGRGIWHWGRRDGQGRMYYFCPAEGGPAEIVDHEALLYRDDDDAVEKITAVLRPRDVARRSSAPSPPPG